MGYVGVVSAACFSSIGHKVTGVDVNDDKVALLNKGVSPIVEKGVADLLLESHQNQKLIATTNAEEAVLSTEISFVCVGTPSQSNGSLNTEYIENVSAQIGNTLAKKDKHIVVIRSTVLPGTCENVIIPIIEEHSGKKEGKDFSLVFNPEFLREASAVHDFNDPPKTVVGGRSENVVNEVLALYRELPGPKIATSFKTAEMIKYVDNNYHALKVTFANEVGQICKKLDIDSHDVMEIFIQDHKLNISPKYFRPGFAFGGSCLPKDLRSINYLSKMMDVEIPLINSLLQSNNIQVQETIKRVLSYNKRNIGIAGFSFKAGTDDLRESPLIEIIETLIGKGLNLKLYDANVALARLVGANKNYINVHIPHISTLMVDSLNEIIQTCDLIIIGNNDREFKKLLTECSKDQIIFDLVKIDQEIQTSAQYEGLYW